MRLHYVGSRLDAEARPLLTRLVEAHATSPELVKKRLAWRHPGFSAHVGEPIAPTDKLRLEDTTAYLVRNPLSLHKFVYLDSQQAVLYRSRMNPSPWDETSKPSARSSGSPA